MAGLVLLLSAKAEGHGLAHAQLVAAETWGAPCVEPEVRTERMWSLGWAYVRPPDMHGTPDYCVMALRDGWWRWSWGTLCTTVVHETGHLQGQGHSGNPRSVMYGSYARTFPGCDGRRVKGRPGSVARVRRESLQTPYWHRRHARAHAQERYHQARGNWRMVRKRKAEARRAHRIAARRSLLRYGPCYGGRWAIPCYIVGCESRGRWSAYNPSGAAGPYQIMGIHGRPWPVTSAADRMAHHRIAARLYARQGARPWVCG